MAAGYDNGDIKLFDLRKMALRWENNLNNGVSVLSTDYSMWCVRFVFVESGNAAFLLVNFREQALYFYNT